MTMRKRRIFISETVIWSIWSVKIFRCRQNRQRRNFISSNVPDSRILCQKKKGNWIFSGRKSQLPDSRELIWNRREKHLAWPWKTFLKNVFRITDNSRKTCLKIYRKREKKHRMRRIEPKNWKRRSATALEKKENWKAGLNPIPVWKTSIMPSIRKN